MKFTLAGCAAAMFALVAVATAPQASAGPERDFLDALADGGLSFSPQATSGIINAGHGVCGSFAKGASYDDVIADVVGGMGGNRRLAGVFVSAAATSFCPKYLAEFP